jgi:hypothetical protein
VNDVIEVQQDAEIQYCGLLFCGTLQSYQFVNTDVSEEHAATIFTLEDQQ